MNQLITATHLTMSTREIAQLLGKQHSNIKISAERLAENGIIALQDTPCIHEQNGQTYYEYHLSKRDSLILVAKNCPEFTAAIVDRWQELELQQSPKLPQSFAQALQLAADQAKTIEDQQAAIAIAAPKVEFVNRYVESKGNKGFRQVAKLLKAKENEFRAYLSVNKILYRLGGEWAPYQCHIDAGRFEVIDNPRWRKDQVYRIKSKSERELFIEQTTKVMRNAGTKCPDNHEYFGIIFDAGARYTDHT